MVQIRATDVGLLLQQLLYAEEVRWLKGLNIEPAPVSQAEMQLARQLIHQSSAESYDPTQFKDDEKARVLAAIDEKMAGKAIVSSARGEDVIAGGQVIDLTDALKASLGGGKAKPTTMPAKTKTPAESRANSVTAIGQAKVCKPVKRAPKASERATAPARWLREGVPRSERRLGEGRWILSKASAADARALAHVVSGLVASGFVTPEGSGQHEISWSY